MIKPILIICSSLILSACGSKGGSPAVVSVTRPVESSEAVTVLSIDSFIGNYDLIEMGEGDCGASLQIIKLCEGVQVRNNHSASESFCNINKGEIKTGDNRSSKNVTFESNAIKSVALLFDERSIPAGQVKKTTIKILTLENGGILRKLSKSDTEDNSCIYQKR